MVYDSAWFTTFSKKYLPAQSVVGLGSSRDPSLSGVGISKMDTGKVQEGEGDSLLIKALLKRVGPSWEGKQVRPEGTHRIGRKRARMGL